ncbi:MAG: adenylyltransferase/cytidyltransferase family protein [Lachnospiraceae bacterium]|nr:adenylyltransferase/cytidyltransferase family protein [Lachnospiraceae bacterium]
MAEKYGVFLARMQPVHNAHLFLVNKALEENDKVLIVLGSENKLDMLRNPFDISLREQMLRECFDEQQNEKITIVTLPDWSMESDWEGAEIWGRYFYYNVVSRIGQKRFALYYSDDPAILDSWFKNTEVYPFITYRNFERSKLFEGLSATKIRTAFMEHNKDYIIQYCPESVVKRFQYLASYYEEVTDNPKPDFSME